VLIVRRVWVFALVQALISICAMAIEYYNKFLKIHKPNDRGSYVRSDKDAGGVEGELVEGVVFSIRPGSPGERRKLLVRAESCRKRVWCILA